MLKKLAAVKADVASGTALADALAAHDLSVDAIHAGLVYADSRTVASVLSLLLTAAAQ